MPVDIIFPFWDGFIPQGGQKGGKIRRLSSWKDAPGQSSPDGFNWDPAKKATLCSKSDLSKKSKIKLREGESTWWGMELLHSYILSSHWCSKVWWSWNLRLAPWCLVFCLEFTVPIHLSFCTHKCLQPSGSRHRQRWILNQELVQVNVYRVEAAGKPPGHER